MTKPIAPHVRKALAGPLQAKKSDPPAFRPAAHLQAAVAAAQAKTAPAGARPPAAHVQAALSGGLQAKAAGPVPRWTTAAGPPSQTIQGFFPGGLTGVVQAVRQGGAVQAKIQGAAVSLPAGLATLQARSGGQPLADGVRRQMEAVFATDFSDVRVHVGQQAASIGAHAFTHGSQIYFAPGRYDPGSAAGLRLLGHELTHVVQQRAGRLGRSFDKGLAIVHDPRLEAEAERMAVRSAVQPCMPARSALPERNRRPVVQAMFSIDRRVFDREWVRYVLRDEVPGLTEAELDHAEGLNQDFKSSDEIKVLILGRRPPVPAPVPVVRVEAKRAPASAAAAAAAAAAAPPREDKWEPRIVNRVTGSSGEHHPILHFAFGDDSKDPEPFDLDNWSNKKKSNTILWPKRHAERLSKAIQAWDCKRCLALDLIEEDLKYATHARRADQAMLLIAVRESISARIDDIPRNCPQVQILDGKVPLEPQLRINWTVVLTDARGKVRAALIAGTPVPADHHNVTFIDDAVMDCKDAGLTMLREAKFLGRADRGVALVTQKVSYKPPGAIRAKAMKAKASGDKSFNFGLGHLRYLIFLEWRVLKEMQDSAAAPATAATATAATAAAAAAATTTTASAPPST